MSTRPRSYSAPAQIQTEPKLITHRPEPLRPRVHTGSCLCTICVQNAVSAAPTPRHLQPAFANHGCARTRSALAGAPAATEKCARWASCARTAAPRGRRLPARPFRRLGIRPWGSVLRGRGGRSAWGVSASDRGRARARASGGGRGRAGQGRGRRRGPTGDNRRKPWLGAGRAPRCPAWSFFFCLRGLAGPVGGCVRGADPAGAGRWVRGRGGTVRWRSGVVGGRCPPLEQATWRVRPRCCLVVAGRHRAGRGVMLSRAESLSARGRRQLGRRFLLDTWCQSLPGCTAFLHRHLRGRLLSENRSWGCRRESVGRGLHQT